VLEAYDQYWGVGPFIKNVIFRIITESTQASIELETGGVDFVLSPAATDVQRIKIGVEGFKAIQTPNNQEGTMYFNYLRDWAKDIRVRQAIAYALDTKAITEMVFPGGLAKVATTTVSSEIWGHYPGYNETPAYPHDEEKAKQLLADAGYGDGLELVLFIDDSTWAPVAAQAIKNQLGKVGITANITAVDGASYIPVIMSGGEYDITLLGHGSTTGEGGGALVWETKTYNPDWDQSNKTELFNDLSANIEAAIETADDEERLQRYYDCQIEIMEQCVKIPMWESPIWGLSVDNLEGITRVGVNPFLETWYFS
jgi:peptide/nickel transport system substrate-binding protein